MSQVPTNLRLQSVPQQANVSRSELVNSLVVYDAAERPQWILLAAIADNKDILSQQTEPCLQDRAL